MMELLRKIQASVEAFNRDAMLQIDTSDNAAGTRARRRALELEELMQEFQLLSLKKTSTDTDNRTNNICLKQLSNLC